MTDLFENPLGLDGFEFVEFAAPEKGLLEPVFESMGFHPHRLAPLEGCASLAAGGNQPDRQLRTAQPRGLFRGRAWPFSLRHGLSRVQDAAAAYDEAVARGAEPVESATGADGTSHPSDQAASAARSST